MGVFTFPKLYKQYQIAQIVLYNLKMLSGIFFLNLAQYSSIFQRCILDLVTHLWQSFFWQISLKLNTCYFRKKTSFTDVRQELKPQDISLNFFKVKNKNRDEAKTKALIFHQEFFQAFFTTGKQFQKTQFKLSFENSIYN